MEAKVNNYPDVYTIGGGYSTRMFTDIFIRIIETINSSKDIEEVKRELSNIPYISQDVFSLFFRVESTENEIKIILNETKEVFITVNKE